MIRSLHLLRTSRSLFAVIFLALMMACSFLGGTPSPTLEPEPFDYCGARLTQLCVVSFGRDALGETIVNLFVPRMKYPAFYMTIVRKTGTDVYECTWSKVDETSVYCAGKALNLDEGIEIQLLAKLDDRLLASGTFKVNAFLVTTPRVEEAPTTKVSGLESGIDDGETSTPEPFQNSEATDIPSDTEQPTSGSYPNYP